MDNKKKSDPSSNTSNERKGYNEANPAQPHGSNTPGTAKEPTESETTTDKKNKPVNAEKKLHGK